MTLYKWFCIVFLIVVFACKDKTPEASPELAKLDLLRGDILLCGNPEFGEVSFALDCKYDVRETFDLAVSLLHSFEYQEAEKAFVKVIDADPECAMAFWGVAMSMYHQLWAPPGPKELKKGAALLDIAETLPKSDRVARYIDAIKIYYKDWETIDHNTREQLYEQKMEAIYKSQGDDVEAAIFYALAITSAADPNDKTYANQKKAGAILQNLFVEQPNHPGIAHYVIHTYDYPEIADAALSTARRYAEIAPASAHAQHMPSHIFTRLGLWEESIETNINSASSAICYSESVQNEGHWAQEIHAMDYLVYAYLQTGNNEKAIQQNNYLKSIKKVFPIDDFGIAYAANAITVRIPLENKQWKKAAQLDLPNIEFNWDKFPWAKSIFHYGKALGSVRSGDLVSAENELKIIQSQHKKLLNNHTAQATYKAGQVLIEIKTVEAWIALASGNQDEALTLMQRATQLEHETSKHPVTPGEILPADELLGDMLLILNKPEEALEAYKTNLKGHPNRFNGIYGAARAAKRLGNTEKATLYFKQLIALAKDTKSNRLELVEAINYINKTTL